MLNFQKLDNTFYCHGYEETGTQTLRVAVQSGATYEESGNEVTVSTKTYVTRIVLGPAASFTAGYPEDAHTQDYCFHIIRNSNGNKQMLMHRKLAKLCSIYSVEYCAIIQKGMTDTIVT